MISDTATSPSPVRPLPEPHLPTDPIVHWLERHSDLVPQFPHLLLGVVRAYGPPVLIAAFGLYVVFSLLRAALWRSRNRFHARGARLVTIALPPDVDPGSAYAWWAHLSGQLAPWWKRLIFAQPHVAYEYKASANGVRCQIWVPGTISTARIQAAVQSAWPGSTITSSWATPPIPVGATAVGGRMTLGNIEDLPLKHNHESDPLRPLLGEMAGLRHGDYAAVQILVRPSTGRRLRRAHRAASHLRGGRSTAPQARAFDLITPGGPYAQPSSQEVMRMYPERAEQVRAILAKAGEPRFEVQIKYAAATTRHLSSLGMAAGVGGRARDLRIRYRTWCGVRSRADGLAGTFALYSSGHQRLRRRRRPAPARWMASRQLARGYLLGASELAALAHLPYDLDAPGVTRAGARPALPSVAVPAAGDLAEPARVLGDSDAGTSRPVALTVKGARQHAHVLGSTGTGKSTFLAGQILADANAERGALVIDPKGDLIADILERLPERAIGKTVLFDPQQPGRPPCLNILAGPNRAFAVEAIVTAFRRCFSANWGPRMEDLMRTACITLLKAHGPRASLADVHTLLTDSAYRNRTVAKVSQDPLLRGFWQDYNELTAGGRAVLISPVMNKLRAVLQRPFVRDALSGASSTVDLGQVLNSGGLVLVRAAKGMLGDDAARLFGSLVLAHAWQAMLPRTHLPEHARRDVTAYIDEAHNFLNLPGSITDILAEARAYRFSLWIAHQHLSQLPADLREAASADARNKIYFAVSPEDGHALVRHTAPLLSEHDLSHLGAYQAAVRIVHNGEPLSAFTMKTRPLPAPIPGRADAVRQASQEAYAPADDLPVRVARPRTSTESLPDLDEEGDDDPVGLAEEADDGGEAGL